jgi:hypothetical protein
VEHKVLRTGFLVGFAGALALVVALVAGVRLAPWVQLLEAFSLLSAFACLFWAEATLDKLDRQLLELGATFNELAEENHKARRALADYILIAQLGAAFTGRSAARTGPQSLVCPVCSSQRCPGIRGMERCTNWPRPITERARGLDPDAWGLTAELPDTEEDTAP